MLQNTTKGKLTYLHYTPHGKINKTALLKDLILFIHQGVIMTVNFVKFCLICFRINVFVLKQKFVLD